MKYFFIIITFTFLLFTQINIVFSDTLDVDFDDEEIDNPIFLNLNDNSVLSFENIHHIYFDLRASRGGNGDVSSAYLMAYEFLLRHNYQGQIYFIIDDKSKRILSNLSGVAEITNGTAISMEGTNRRNLICYQKIGFPANAPAADMYISLAKPSGNIIGYDERYIVGKPKGSSAWIPVKKDTFYIFQTVLGNTENKKARFPYSTVYYKGLSFLMSPAGLGPGETGIYWDYVAQELRGQTKSKIMDYLKTQLAAHKSRRDIAVIESLIFNRKQIFANNGNMKVGLVYGVTHYKVREQFQQYLVGLSKYGKKNGTAYTIISPSGISEDTLGEVLSKKIALYPRVSDVDFNSFKTDPGDINIVTTDTLPHTVFTSLLASSEFTPIIAGDAALSAALILGKPFAMTKIDWNSKNIENLLKLLGVEILDEDKVLTNENLWSSYLKANLKEVVGKINKTKKDFFALEKKIFFLSDNILKGFNQASMLEAAGMTLEQIREIKNDEYRIYKLFKLAVDRQKNKKGQELEGILPKIKPEGHYAFIKYIIENPEESELLLDNHYFFQYLIEVLVFEGHPLEGLTSLNTNRGSFKKIFPILKNILPPLKMMKIIEEILKNKTNKDLISWDNEALKAILEVLLAIDSDRSIQLVEEYFLFGHSSYVALPAVSGLMLTDKSKAIKNSYKILDLLLNKTFGARHIVGEYFLKKINETGRSPTVYGWKVLELLKREKLIFLISDWELWTNEEYRRNYVRSLSFKKKQLIVKDISDAAWKFFEQYPPEKSTCEILMH